MTPHHHPHTSLNPLQETLCDPLCTVLMGRINGNLKHLLSYIIVSFWSFWNKADSSASLLSNFALRIISFILSTYPVTGIIFLAAHEN